MQRQAGQSPRGHDDKMGVIGQYLLDRPKKGGIEGICEIEVERFGQRSVRNFHLLNRCTQLRNGFVELRA